MIRAIVIMLILLFAVDIESGWIIHDLESIVIVEFGIIYAREGF